MTDELHLMLALTNAVSGREADFDEWYDTYHLPEICALPGMVRAQRFKFASHQITLPAGMPAPAPMPHYEHLAVYEIQGPLEAMLTAMSDARSGGVLHTTDAIDRTTNRGILYTAHRPPLVPGG